MTTKIEWAAVPDGKGGFKIPRTWNPQVGCREISPACRECYAATLAHRGMSPQHKGLTVMRTNAAGEKLGVHWNGEINRVPHLLAEPLSWRRPSGVFVGSMTDLYFDVETDEACRWIAAIFGIMAACPQHTFMVLTKRPENAARWFAWLDEQAEGMEDEAAPAQSCLSAAIEELARLPDGGFNTSNVRDRIRRRWHRDDLAWPLPNVWVGSTMEDQRRVDERWPELERLPAAVRFISYEPACGPIVLPPSALDGKLHQLILGGESGPRARPSHPQWFRDAIAQCEAAGVAVFFKQWGEWCPADQLSAQAYQDVENRDPSMVETDKPVRVGKKTAGRLLDGREYNGFPEVRHV